MIAQAIRPNGLPDYTLRVSARARRVRLEMSARNGLVVIVPKGFARKHIPGVLKEMQGWIERAMTRVNRESLAEPASVHLPEEIHLQALGEKWAVHVQQTGVSKVKALEQPPGILVLSGNTSKVPVCLSQLDSWLNKKSHERLVPWLREVSAEQGLPFGRTMVKSQRTRWASCSSRKTISINRNLLFLPGHLVRYVFIHELCHTVHLNHSSEFWNLVHEREPDCAALRAELRKARQLVPAWVEQECNPLT